VKQFNEHVSMKRVALHAYIYMCIIYMSHNSWQQNSHDARPGFTVRQAKWSLTFNSIILHYL